MVDPVPPINLRWQGQSCIITTYDEKNLLDIVALEQQANPYPWTLANFQSSLANRHLCLALFNAEDHRVLAHAVFSCVAGEAELLIIAVHPQYKGRGLATLLLSSVLPHLKNHAHTVFLEVRESNVAAISLYDAAGFNHVGVRPRYYPASSGRAEDALIYALDLSFFEPAAAD